MAEAHPLMSLHPHPLRSNPVLPEDIPKCTTRSDGGTMGSEKLSLSSGVELSATNNDNEEQITRLSSAKIFPALPYHPDDFTTSKRVQESGGMTEVSNQEAQQPTVLLNNSTIASSSHGRKALPSLRHSMWMHFGSANPELQYRHISWSSVSDFGHGKSIPNLSTEMDASVVADQQPVTLTGQILPFAQIRRLLDFIVGLESFNRFHTTLLQTYLDVSNTCHKKSITGKFRGLLIKKTKRPTRQEIEDLEAKIKQIKAYQRKVSSVAEKLKENIIESDIAVLEAELNSTGDEGELLDETEGFLNRMGRPIGANITRLGLS